MEETESNQQLKQLSEIFKRYIKRQGDRLSPTGIYCKKHAIQLKLSLEKRAEFFTYEIAKVQKISPEVPDLEHKSGGIYNFHYLVVADTFAGKFALDPFLRTISDNLIPQDQYIQTAYNNPEFIVWGTPQI